MEKICQFIRDQAINDYLKGMSYREVGRKYNIDHKTVRIWVKKSGSKQRTKEEVNILMSKKVEGQRRSIDTEFKEGTIPWNKDTKGVMKPNKTSFKKGIIPSNWKGENVGYYSLHSWVNRHKGRAKICEFCGSKKNVQWANKSLEYKRDLNDWIELCCKCHRKYDLNNGWGNATKKYPEMKTKRRMLCLQEQK
jgi:hypothetical protein